MPKKTTTNHSVIPEKLLNPSMNQSLSRFLVEDKSSLVRIPTDDMINERENKEEWAESDSNQRPPPCQGGILTRLDHRPHIHAGKFVAQIYVIDPLSCGNTSSDSSTRMIHAATTEMY